MSLVKDINLVELLSEDYIEYCYEKIISAEVECLMSDEKKFIKFKEEIKQKLDIIKNELYECMLDYLEENHSKDYEICFEDIDYEYRTSIIKYGVINKITVYNNKIIKFLLSKHDNGHKIGYYYKSPDVIEFIYMEVILKILKKYGVTNDYFIKKIIKKGVFFDQLLDNYFFEDIVKYCYHRKEFEICDVYSFMN